jgi:hypothetical protein
MRAVTLYLRQARNGEVRVAAVKTDLPWRGLVAVDRWARGSPAESLNQCDQWPFACATYTKTSRRRPCPTCRARAALGFRPVKGYQRRKKGGK